MSRKGGFVVLALLALAALLLWRMTPARRALPRAGAREEVPAESPPAPEPPAARDPPVVHRPPTMETHGDTEALGELGTLRGRVVYEDATPVRRAILVLASSPLPPANGEPLSRVRITGVGVSDVHGDFELPVAHGGLWKLLVRLGEDLVLVRDEPPAGDFLEIVLPREPTTLELEFVDLATGEPVVPRFVHLWLGAGDIVPWKGAPSARISWTPAPIGRYPVVASFAEHEALLGPWVHVEPGMVTHRRIELHRGQTVLGTVVDAADGQPVRAAWVHVGHRDGPRTVRAPTDAHGRFELSRVPWDPRTRRSLTVEARGYAATTRLIGAVEEDGGGEELVIRLERPATLLARCVDEQGRPLAHVAVRAQSFPEIDPRTIDVDTATKTTRGDGRVELRLAPGGAEAILTCWWHGVRALERSLPPLGASERRDLGDLVIRAPATLLGTVRTPDGKPAAGAVVVVEPQRPADTGHYALSNAILVPERWARCDASGRFAVRGLQPGLWDLLVHGGGHPRLLHVGVEVPRGAEPEPLDLRLPAAVSLEGRVVDASGAPVAGASVAFMRLHPVPSSLLEAVTTDAQGRFAIPAFTREDEAVPLWVTFGGTRVEREVTPRDGPVSIVLE
jgi:hypothetical protein